MHEKTERRLQRHISRLTHQRDALKASSAHFKQRAIALAKQINPTGTSAEILAMAGFQTNPPKVRSRA